MVAVPSLEINRAARRAESGRDRRRRPGPPAVANPSHPPRLLDQLRAAIRLRYHSPRTEDASVHWTRRFILFHDKRQPKEMGVRRPTSWPSRTLARLSSGRPRQPSRRWPRHPRPGAANGRTSCAAAFRLRRGDGGQFRRAGVRSLRRAATPHRPHPSGGRHWPHPDASGRTDGSTHGAARPLAAARSRVRRQLNRVRRPRRRAGEGVRRSHGTTACPRADRGRMLANRRRVSDPGVPAGASV